MGGEPRTSVTITVYGETLDKLLTNAKIVFQSFFGKTEYEIIEIRTTPRVREITGAVVMWEAEVEASDFEAARVRS